MKKKILNYKLLLFLFLLFILTMGFGSILKYHFDGGKKYKFLQKTTILISSIPINILNIIKYKTLNFDRLLPLKKHEDKKKFENFIPNQRNALLVSSRFSQSLQRSVVDIIDLNGFEVLHTYKHDIVEMHKQVKNIKLFPNINVEHSPYKFRYFDPIIMNDGSLLSHNYKGPLFKIDFCSNLQWINDDQKFHHTNTLDRYGNVWLGVTLNPQSKYINKYSIKEYEDDAIANVDPNGNLLYTKSVNELLIENKILPKNFAFNSFISSKDKNPIHLNDIEPAFSDTKHWKQDDLFLSIRDQNAIVHYRPSVNKVINFIVGPFGSQHDVDIISENELSIFNNNNFLDKKYSEVIIYNFDTKKFKKLFNNQLKDENFKTKINGTSHIFKDGSLMIEESWSGRIILFNNQGKKEWEYINKDENDEIGLFSFSRIIEDEVLIEKIKTLVENNKCIK